MKSDGLLVFAVLVVLLLGVGVLLEGGITGAVHSNGELHNADEDCQVNSDCKSGYCNPSLNLCAVPGQDFTTCKSNNDCIGFLCVDSEDGRICASTCTVSCQEGFNCIQTGSIDQSNYCVPESVDTDGDGIPDVEDNCKFKVNPSQGDADGNGIGDVCQMICLNAVDCDGDGVLDDGDGSGVEGDNYCTFGTKTNCDDNCPFTPNSDQADIDADGVGNICDTLCKDTNPKCNPGSKAEDYCGADFDNQEFCDPLGSFGYPCENDDNCNSGVCLYQDINDKLKGSICTETCETECTVPGWSCVAVQKKGELKSVCLPPENFCLGQATTLYNNGNRCGICFQEDDYLVVIPTQLDANKYGVTTNQQFCVDQKPVGPCDQEGKIFAAPKTDALCAVTSAGLRWVACNSKPNVGDFTGDIGESNMGFLDSNDLSSPYLCATVDGKEVWAYCGTGQVGASTVYAGGEQLNEYKCQGENWEKEIGEIAYYTFDNTALNSKGWFSNAEGFQSTDDGRVSATKTGTGNQLKLPSGLIEGREFYTISFWARTVGGTIISAATEFGTEMEIKVDESKLYLNYKGKTTEFSAGLADGQWHNYVIRKDINKLDLIIDPSLVGSTAVTPTVPGSPFELGFEYNTVPELNAKKFFTITAPGSLQVDKLIIGSSQVLGSSFTNHLKGHFDEFRMWNMVRSDEEIKVISSEEFIFFDKDKDSWSNFGKILPSGPVKGDNCPDIFNPDQGNIDGDNLGDVCDPDTDNDGILDDGDNSGKKGDKLCTAGETQNCDDNCPTADNPNQLNTDGDGYGDACDVCPFYADDQTDTDNDGLGDACDLCPYNPNPDLTEDQCFVMDENSDGCIDQDEILLYKTAFDKNLDYLCKNKANFDKGDMNQDNCVDMIDLKMITQEIAEGICQ